MQGTVSDEAIANREIINQIKNLYLQGKISREVAEALSAPTIQKINKRQAEIAKKWNKKHRPVTFTGLMR